MGKCAGNFKQSYVYHPRDISKLTCIINVPGDSSDEFKVINNFGAKYVTCRIFNESIQETTFNKRVFKNQELNDIVQHAVDDIILQ